MAPAVLGAVAAATLFLTPVHASVATRCGDYGCSHIICNHTGDRCRRIWGDFYRGYDGGWRYRDGYGGYDRDGYDRDGYGGYDRDGYGPDYGRYGTDGGYYDGRGWHYDCDNDGDECYVKRSW